MFFYRQMRTCSAAMVVGAVSAGAVLVRTIPVSCSLQQLSSADDDTKPRYADDAQAGGHVNGVRFMGTMLHKRLQNEGRGDREVAALAALAQSPRWHDFVPQFGGVQTESGGESWLMMENLAAGMLRPAVMDIKIGTRHFSSDAPAKKIAKERKKAETTTIGTHGLRSKSRCWPQVHTYTS